MGVETTGAWDPSAQKLVRTLVRRQSMRTGLPVVDVAGAVWRRLGLAVAKGVGQMLLRGYSGSSAEDAAAGNLG